eukprot:COSAG06_NODE_37868_length_430_cov_0.779456_2_plen_82_part_01
MFNPNISVYATESTERIGSDKNAGRLQHGAAAQHSAGMCTKTREGGVRSLLLQCLVVVVVLLLLLVVVVVVVVVVLLLLVLL